MVKQTNKQRAQKTKHHRFLEIGPSHKCNWTLVQQPISTARPELESAVRDRREAVRVRTNCGFWWNAGIFIRKLYLKHVINCKLIRPIGSPNLGLLANSLAHHRSPCSVSRPNSAAVFNSMASDFVNNSEKKQPLYRPMCYTACIGCAQLEYIK